MDNRKVLMSIGTALAASGIAKSISGIGLNDVLGPLGLSRRRSHVLENIGLVALGAVVGGGVALLLAPSSGREARERLSNEASKLSHAAVDALRERKDEAFRSLAHVGNGTVSDRA